MQGPWKATSKLLERVAANESGQGFAEEARMQGYPWDGCPSLLFVLTVYGLGPEARICITTPDSPQTRMIRSPDN
eukprot:1343041-Pyramimonas_sp.AAC.1